jgi:hypothetical protein
MSAAAFAWIVSFINFSQLFVFFWFTLLSSLIRDVISNRDAGWEKYSLILDLPFVICGAALGTTGAPN